MSGIFDGLGELGKATSSRGEFIFVPSSQPLQILTENFNTGRVLGFSKSSPLFIQSSDEENASTTFNTKESGSSNTTNHLPSDVGWKVASQKRSRSEQEA